MKIAAAAYPIDWHNRWNDYVGKLRVWVRTAAEQGAEVLVFSESTAMELASLAGDDNARDLQKVVDAVSARIKDVDDLHGSLAREFKVHICAASAPLRRKTDGATVGRARFFAPDGSFGDQEKLVPTRPEREAWGIVPGGGPRVFQTDIGAFGILIGYDVVFPTVARALAEAGAEVLLVPSRADGTRAYARLRTAASARALENQCVVAHSVTVGEVDWLPDKMKSHGAAAIFGPPDIDFPEDGVIAMGKAGAAGWVHGEVSLEAVRHVRAEGQARVFEDWPDRMPAVETVRLGGAAPSRPQE